MDGVDLEDLRDGLVRALAVAQRRVDELEHRLRCVQRTSRACVSRTAARACEMHAQSIPVETLYDEGEAPSFPAVQQNATKASRAKFTFDVSLPEISDELTEPKSLLREAYDAGEACGLEAGLAIGSWREEQIVEELAATKRALVEEGEALRMQHAKAVNSLRRERSERVRVDAEREDALRAAANAAEKLEWLRREVAVAKTKEYCFGRHAVALKAAVSSMNEKHALALEQALRARDVVVRKRTDIVLVDAVKKALRSREETRRNSDESHMLRSVVAAVDRVCDEADSIESQPELPKEEGKKHRYLKKGTAEARLRERQHRLRQSSSSLAPESVYDRR